MPNRMLGLGIMQSGKAANFGTQANVRRIYIYMHIYNYLINSCVRLRNYIYILLITEHNGDVSPENYKYQRMSLFILRYRHQNTILDVPFGG